MTKKKVKKVVKKVVAKPLVDVKKPVPKKVVVDPRLAEIANLKAKIAARKSELSSATPREKRRKLRQIAIAEAKLM